MGLLDRLRDAVSDDDEKPEPSAHPDAAGPAAASGETQLPAPRSPGDTADSSGGGELSEASSGLGGDAQTAEGGADAVPDTPDGVAEDYT